MSGRGQRQDARARRATAGAAPWIRAVRGPWTVVCTVAAVVVGPAAATALALDRANAAPLHAPARESTKSLV
ncbi:hypothetical protein ACH41H_12660 [Streptomyces sp. NPDC020800]|uniref:hypothetical protein n=1 Tax=Streptomyces sp. NPDC020800 TaxID=3365092 RepID=UPI00379F4BDE